MVKTDLEKQVLVNLPITDAEIFTHLFFGQKPVERPIKMSYGGFKFIQTFARIVIAGMLLFTFIGVHQEYGSFSNTYHSFMQQSENLPPKMYNTNF